MVLRLDAPGAFPLGAMMGQINWVAAGMVTYPYSDGAIAARNGAVIGPMSRAVTAQVSAPFVLVVAKLSPLGWRQLVRADASSLTDRCATLADLCPGLARLTLDPDWSDSHLASVVGAAIYAEMAREPAESASTRFHLAALDRWAASPTADAAALRDFVALGDRQLTRFTNRLLGLSPGKLVRRTRVLRTVAAMARRPHLLDAEDMIAGYSDQSHFIREFSRFAGMTPGAFAAQLEDRRTLMLRERWCDQSDSALARLG